MNVTADRLLLFGATGDLAQRMLLPSLCALDAEGLLDRAVERQRGADLAPVIGEMGDRFRAD